MRSIDKLPFLFVALSAVGCGDPLPGLPPLVRREAGVDSGGLEDGGTAPDDGGTGGADAGKAPSGEWKSAVGNLAEHTKACGAMRLLKAEPDEDRLLAQIANEGFYASTNGGQTWTPLGDGPTSAKVINIGTSLIFDPTNPNVFWETGIYQGNGIYQTTDNGKTFTAVGNATHFDALSVDFSDPERKVLLVGGHEQVRAVQRSDDKGITLRNVADTLPDNKNCTWPYIVNATTYLVGCSHFTRGIYRTTDRGVNWTAVSPEKGGTGVPLRTTSGALFWPDFEGAALMRSTDDGASWQELPGVKVSFEGMSPVELSGGQIAVMGVNEVLVSSDGGDSWRPASVPLPYNAGQVIGFTYSTHQKAFFVAHRNNAAGDAKGGCAANTFPSIMRYDYPE